MTRGEDGEMPGRSLEDLRAISAPVLLSPGRFETMAFASGETLKGGRITAGGPGGRLTGKQPEPGVLTGNHGDQMPRVRH